MYTQCNHCKAIFRVTMKELTTAQGLLRCGECDAIFDAMKSLSTTLPEERRFAQNKETAPSLAQPEQLADEVVTPRKSRIQQKSGSSPNWFAFWKKGKSSDGRTTRQGSATRKAVKRPAYKRSSSSRNFLLIGIAALALLLLLQWLYSSRNWLARQPLTSTFTRQACEMLGCDVRIPKDVRQIKLLSRNVYSHPNTPDVLTISASIQNDAVFQQPYPLIEISFLSNENEIVALRRFTPEEYIRDFNGELMPTGVPAELVLNIADPGEEAVRFQFRFL